MAELVDAPDSKCYVQLKVPNLPKTDTTQFEEIELIKIVGRLTVFLTNLIYPI